MSKWMFVALTCLRVCALFSIAASQDSPRQGGTLFHSLGDIAEAPDMHVGGDVSFLCRFAGATTSFDAPRTGFTVATHANFAVWSDREELWTSEGRRRIFPALFIDRKNRNLVESLNRLERYDLVVVTGRVTGHADGIVWILVDGIGKAAPSGPVLTEAAVQHMRAGLAALADGDGRTSGAYFDQALAAGLPPEFQASAHELAADAACLASDIPKAKSCLVQAIRAGKDFPSLRLALAYVNLQLGDPDAAMDECAAFMAHAEYRIRAHGIAAEAMAMRGDPIEALDRLQEAGAAPGVTALDEAILAVHRARIYKIANHAEDAVRLYAELAGPGGPLAEEKWLHIEHGSLHENLYLAGGDPVHLDLATQAYERGVAPGRGGCDTLYKLAELEMRRQKISWHPTVAKAEAIIREIFSLHPEYLPARIIEARIVCAGGDIERARRLCDSFAGRADGDPLALAALAEAYADLGDLERAGRLAGQAAALQPWNERLRAIGDGLAIIRPKRDEPFSATDSWDAFAFQTMPDSDVFMEQVSAWDAALTIQAMPDSAVYTEQASVDDDWDTAFALQAMPELAVFTEQEGREDSSNALAIPSGLGDMVLVADLAAVGYADSAMPEKAVRHDGFLFVESVSGGMVEEIRASVPPATGAPSYPVSSFHFEPALSSRPLPPPAARAEAGMIHESIRRSSSPPRHARRDRLESPLPSKLLVPPPAAHGPVSSLGPPSGRSERGDSPVALAAFAPRVTLDIGDEQALEAASRFSGPDRSFAFTAEHGANESGSGALPARNANLYRKVRDGAKRPAEVTMGDAARSGRQDESAMAPPRDGTVPRTEVLLPGSPQGIGVDHELTPLW